MRGGDAFNLTFDGIVDWNADPYKVVYNNFSAFDAAVRVTDKNSGSYVVAYNLTKTGDYLVSLFINKVKYHDKVYTTGWPVTIGPDTPFAAQSVGSGGALASFQARHTATTTILGEFSSLPGSQTRMSHSAC